MRLVKRAYAALVSIWETLMDHYVLSFTLIYAGYAAIVLVAALTNHR